MIQNRREFIEELIQKMIKASRLCPSNVKYLSPSANVLNLKHCVTYRLVKGYKEKKNIKLYEPLNEVENLRFFLYMLNEEYLLMYNRSAENAIKECTPKSKPEKPQEKKTPELPTEQLSFNSYR